MGFFRRLLNQLTGQRARAPSQRGSRRAAGPAMPPLVSTDEQIEALLSGRAQALMRHLYEEGIIASYDYEDVFTFSQNEMEDYVARNGVPGESHINSKAACARRTGGTCTG